MANLQISYASTIYVDVSSASALAEDAWAESDIVVNATTTANYVDVMVVGQIRTNGSATTNDTVEFYAYAKTDAGISSALTGSLNGGLDGSDSVETEGTAFHFQNLPLLGVINAETASAHYHFGPWALSQIFGGIMPQEWGIIIHNNTQGILGATPRIGYQGIKYESV